MSQNYELYHKKVWTKNTQLTLHTKFWIEKLQVKQRANSGRKHGQHLTPKTYNYVFPIFQLVWNKKKSEVTCLNKTLYVFYGKFLHKTPLKLCTGFLKREGLKTTNLLDIFKVHMPDWNTFHNVKPEKW